MVQGPAERERRSFTAVPSSSVICGGQKGREQLASVEPELTTAARERNKNKPTEKKKKKKYNL